MLHALFCKFRLLVLRLVKTHDERHSHFFKDWHIIIWREGAVAIRDIKRARKGHELAGNDPVEISILYLLEVLVLLHVEGVVIVPAQGYSVL